MESCKLCRIGVVEAGWDDICPVCGWQDDPLQAKDRNYAGGANELSFNDYKKQFEDKRKNDPNYVWEGTVVDYNFGKNRPAEFKEGASN
jgi:hypothetical protein